MNKKCPKCGFINEASDATLESSCPQCGVIYSWAEVSQNKKSKMTSEERLRLQLIKERTAYMRGQESTSGSNEDDNQSSSVYEILLIAIPVIATIFVIFWIGSMRLIDSPASKLLLIVVCTVTSTGLIAAMETSKASGKNPIGWFFLIILIWFIGYPYYMKARSENGLKSRFWIGLIAAVLFVGSTIYFGVLIDEAQSDLEWHLRNF